MIRRAVATAAVVLLAPSAAGAATYDWDKDASHRFRVWVPDDVTTLRGVLVHFNGSGDDDRQLVDDNTFYESFVRTMDFAFIGTFYDWPTNPDDLRDALSQFAAMSKHPELASAPVLIEGLSQGGWAAVQWAMAYPERTIAYVNGATRSYPTIGTGDAQKHTPSLHFIGTAETPTNVSNFVAGVTSMRAQGHQVGHFLQWDVAHKWGQGLWVARNFLAACYSLRYPTSASPAQGPVKLLPIDDAQGWLTDPTTYDGPFASITAAKSFSGDATKQFWLPSQDLAFMVRAHATHQKPVSFANASTSVWPPIEVNPGDSVPLEVTIDPSFPGVSKVQFFDGAALIGEVTAAPYKTTWKAQRSGAHGIVAVAVDGGGAQRTGFLLPVVVSGKAPGASSTPSGASDAGAGPPGNGGSSGAPAGGSGAAPGGGDAPPSSGASSGCACRTTACGPDAFAAGAIVLAVLGLLRARAKRRD
jgi:pimeloyl-ACP methyl ester carboxylesterase